MSNKGKKFVSESVRGNDTYANILSIVIPAYNCSKLLSRCLEALEKQSVPKVKFEVIVADDGSTDDILEMLSHFKERNELNLQWTSITNSGPGNARNAGVSMSTGSWIGFMDADVIPDQDWVKNAIQLIHQKPDAGAFEGRTEVTQRNLATPFTHQTENIDGGRYLTCNFLVRRNLANFYPAYRIPFREDTDLAFSILDSGYSIIFAPQLIVAHPPLSSSYSRPLALARRYYYDGLIARRFPSRYKMELDAHQICGLKIPHLKRKLYTIFALSQIVFLVTLSLSFSPTDLLFPVIVYLTGFSLTLVGGLRFVNLRDLSLKDWVIFIIQLHFLPWIMGYSLLRGWFDFRGEPEFMAR